MSKPFIAITCSRDMLGNNEVHYAHTHYIDAIIRAGGIPVFLPIGNIDDINQMTCFDGLLVTGGIDVNPMYYHESCHFLLGESDGYRDQYEISLIKEFEKQRKPILGICRGLQIINVAYGGTLYQDNRLKSENIQQHVQKERRDYPIHSIHIEQKSFLSPIFGEQAYVNSFHHQSIKQTAKDFKVIAKSDDDIIEAIEHIHLPIYAVQFHPEKMENDEKMNMIFNMFVQKCINEKR